MKNMLFVIVGILCVTAAGADAQSFEQQLSQFSRNAAVMTRQNRENFQAVNAQSAAVQGQAAWQKVTGPNGTFTVEMPSAPQHSTGLLQNGETYHLYNVTMGPREYDVLTVSYPSGDVSLEGALAGTATTIDGGKWISVTWTKHQGLPAVEAVGLLKGAEYRTLWVMRGQQLFGLAHRGPDGTGRSEDANRFFSSLNIR